MPRRCRRSYIPHAAVRRDGAREWSPAIGAGASRTTASGEGFRQSTRARSSPKGGLETGARREPWGPRRIDPMGKVNGATDVRDLPALVAHPLLPAPCAHGSNRGKCVLPTKPVHRVCAFSPEAPSARRTALHSLTECSRGFLCLRSPLRCSVSRAEEAAANRTTQTRERHRRQPRVRSRRRRPRRIPRRTQRGGTPCRRVDALSLGRLPNRVAGR